MCDPARQCSRGLHLLPLSRMLTSVEMQLPEHVARAHIIVEQLQTEEVQAGCSGACGSMQPMQSMGSCVVRQSCNPNHSILQLARCSRTLLLPLHSSADQCCLPCKGDHNAIQRVLATRQCTSAAMCHARQPRTAAGQCNATPTPQASLTAQPALTAAALSLSSFSVASGSTMVPSLSGQRSGCVGSAAAGTKS